MDKSLKMQVVTIKNYLDTGITLTNSLKQIFYVFVGATLVADSPYVQMFGVSPLVLGFTAGVFYMFVCYVFGYYWDRYKMFHLTNDWNNTRNDMLKNINKNIRPIAFNTPREMHDYYWENYVKKKKRRKDKG